MDALRRWWFDGDTDLDAEAASIIAGDLVRMGHALMKAQFDPKPGASTGKRRK